MTAPINKPVSQEVLDKFRAYKNLTGSWRDLKHVLEYQNVKESDIAICMQECIKGKDRAGVVLCGHLMEMSKSQRIKIARTITD